MVGRYFRPGRASQRPDAGTAAHPRLGRALDRRQGTREAGQLGQWCLPEPSCYQPAWQPGGVQGGAAPWPCRWEEVPRGPGGLWAAWRLGRTAQ